MPARRAQGKSQIRNNSPTAKTPRACLPLVAAKGMHATGGRQGDAATADQGRH